MLILNYIYILGKSHDLLFQRVSEVPDADLHFYFYFPVIRAFIFLCSCRHINWSKCLLFQILFVLNIWIIKLNLKHIRYTAIRSFYIACPYLYFNWYINVEFEYDICKIFLYRHKSSLLPLTALLRAILLFVIVAFKKIIRKRRFSFWDLSILNLILLFYIYPLHNKR